jgi:hypothetical protein
VETLPLAFGSRMGTMNRHTNQDHGLRAAVLLELVGGGDAWTRAVRLLVISTPLFHTALKGMSLTP